METVDKVVYTDKREIKYIGPFPRTKSNEVHKMHTVRPKNNLPVIECQKKNEEII